MRRLLTMDDVPLDGKRVLVRADFNVSVGDDGKVDEDEDFRIEAVIPTIEELMQRRCRIILLTHHEEDGQPVADGDLAPIHHRLEDLLHEEVRLLRHLYGADVESSVAGMEPGSAVLLPNVRSDQREMQPNEKFAHELAQHADMYINEAFGVCHRDHTSVTLLPKLLLHAAGRRTVMEVQAMGRLVETPAHPYVAIVSGIKIDTKIAMLRQLLPHVDKLCLGGRIANVFLAAMGKFPAADFTDMEISSAKTLLESADDKLVLPVDGGQFDIGPQSVKNIMAVCEGAKTIMWNGPLGKFEVPEYGISTKSLADQLALNSAYRVVGGGDTVKALEMYHLVQKFNHVSVGGGAMIAFLEGKQLPGLTPLYST